MWMIAAAVIAPDLLVIWLRLKMRHQPEDLAVVAGAVAMMLLSVAIRNDFSCTVLPPRRLLRAVWRVLRGIYTYTTEPARKETERLSEEAAEIIRRMMEDRRKESGSVR